MKTVLFAIATLVAWQGFAQSVELTEAVTIQVEKNGVKMQQEILANSLGQTLYTFDPDKNVPGKSVCNGKCAEEWPPISLSAAEVKALNNPDFAVVKRDSGLNQLTFKGEPVYLFHFDRVPGGIKGDNLGSVWHIIPLSALTPVPAPEPTPAP